jgi:hypothetical protein
VPDAQHRRKQQQHQRHHAFPCHAVHLPSMPSLSAYAPEASPFRRQAWLDISNLIYSINTSASFVNTRMEKTPPRGAEASMFFESVLISVP